MKILDEISRRLEIERRSPQELFAYLKQNGMMIFMARRINQEQVIGCCVAMISMYEQLEGKE